MANLLVCWSLKVLKVLQRIGNENVSLSDLVSIVNINFYNKKTETIGEKIFFLIFIYKNGENYIYSFKDNKTFNSVEFEIQIYLWYK